MRSIIEFLQQNKDIRIALYGLGTETERFLAKCRVSINIVGLLDGFREDGELYGYPILSMEHAIKEGVKLIIVIARPGSCKAITKRIGVTCKENDIALYDVRGKDLLEQTAIRYDFSMIKGETKTELLAKIKEADVVSFDMFDTLIMRKVYSYTDLFELMDYELKSQGIIIPDFARRRLSAEKELSKNGAPTLEKIYGEVLREVGGNFLSEKEMAEMEWSIDFSIMIPRPELIDIFRETVNSGKEVIITTDSYYSRNQLEQIFSQFGLVGYKSIYISCEYDTSKTQGLYIEIVQRYGDKKILHIGDDEVADIEKASEREMDTFRIFSGADLFDALGGLGTEEYNITLSDHVKCGLFISHIFRNPFQFESETNRLSIPDAGDIGYLFCGSMITDFILWLKERVKQENFGQVLFCARDGYLLGRLYRKSDAQTKSIYFLASRAAAIRAGMENDEDIAYVDSMKYFGTPEDALKTRFGIELKESDEALRRDSILDKAEKQRNNYRKYIEKLDIKGGSLAMFDFVAKGTTQMYLERVFERKIKGFYFLQLEPEYMADKKLDIKPFYTDEEKNRSVLFDNYYILETMLTSPYPQMEEFDEDGNPRFAKETRREKDIRCLERAQQGIMNYFEDYISLLPEVGRTENKKLNEVFLSLVNRVEITDEDFLSLTVEDPFFGRMTDIKAMIG